MRKDYSNALKRIAAKLPLIFEWEMGIDYFYGWELNLTPLGEGKNLDPLKEYPVQVPQMRAVLHEQQLKDAYKKYGVDGVQNYVDSVNKRAGLVA